MGHCLCLFYHPGLDTSKSWFIFLLGGADGHEAEYNHDNCRDRTLDQLRSKNRIMTLQQAMKIILKTGIEEFMDDEFDLSPFE